MKIWQIRRWFLLIEIRKLFCAPHVDPYPLGSQRTEISGGLKESAWGVSKLWSSTKVHARDVPRAGYKSKKKRKVLEPGLSD